MKDIITVEQEELLINRCDEIDIRKKNALMREVIHELQDTLKQTDLVALSAPMIGYNARIFCVKFDNKIKAFINPIITQAKGLEVSRETSPCIPNKEYIRIRNNDITVMYQNPINKVETRRIVGKASIIIQQMIDSLDGLLLSDIGMELDEDFDKATDDERAEVINMYLETLELTAKELNKEILEDADTKKIQDAMDFMESVNKGETVLDEELVSMKKSDVEKPAEEIVPKKRGRKKKAEVNE